MEIETSIEKYSIRDKRVADLYRQLEQYGSSDYYPFHMPGHKRNKEGLEGVLAETCGIDITEIDGFDNLHQAQGILQKAQNRAAHIYGSGKTYFLVNGSTCGILSAIAAVTTKGSRLLMARNCHKSVYHAVYLQELRTTFLYPRVNSVYGIAEGIDSESVEQALEREPDIGAVIITSPTYEGVVSDVKGIADICHRYGKPLIVDEAHGAHFGFHEGYPVSSVGLGADLVIHSLHKTLPSMTQTALLHINGELVDRERLERYLRIFQSSSPSYVLMASMDECLDILQREGHERLDRLLHYRERLLRRIGDCRYLCVAEESEGKKDGMTGRDPCKLVIYAADGCMTGQQLYDLLRENYHLQMEMAAENYVLAILSMMDSKEGLDRLGNALVDIDNMLIERADDVPVFGKEEVAWCEMEETGARQQELNAGQTEVSARQQETNTGQADVECIGVRQTDAEAVMTLAQAYDAEKEQVLLSESTGRIAAEFINLYPPGIPLVVPGERINSTIADTLAAYEAMGMNVQGVDSGYMKAVK